MDDTDKSRIQLEVQQEYLEFLDDNNDNGHNIEKIKEMIKKSSVRLIVNVNDLRKKNPARCAKLLESGFEEMPLIQRALREVVATINTDYAKENEEFFIGLEGSFGTKHVTPRTLTSRFLGNTVCVEGIVTKCSTIRPKVVRSMHYCPATKKSMERRYADISSFDVIPTVNMYPTKDDDGNLLETEYGLSKYRDHQTITIQEMPEKAPTGQLPRSLDIVLENDLVDICKPGDRILIVGVYRCLPSKQGGYTTGVFRTVLLTSHVTLMAKDANLRITHEDVKDCKKFSRTSNPFATLARSLAPSIHGHEFIKKAVLCLLLGGVERILPNGTRLRGDINVLLIGDPSVAKSQMLRYVSNVAPRVVMTTGRGSSGVGLTAAVTTDSESGERRLEAGAMVLADKGIVCIDEFDKMSDADRTAIHEVMEQGRVTISKAGIHARLNARTAVLAAANPVYGRYDEYKSPMDNIGLQDSLLSRFDLLFIVLDSAEPDLDRKVAEHVLRMHRYRNPGEQDGEATSLCFNDMMLSTKDLEEDSSEKTRTQTYEKHDPLLHGQSKSRKDKILSMEFMKKYIHIAKCIKPKLSDEAAKVIAEEYSRLRSQNMADSNSSMARTQPITARSLETMIRLSTAHARARMARDVSKDDALAAIELVQFAIFKKVLERDNKRKKRNDDSDAENEMDASPTEQADAERPGSSASQNSGGETPSSRKSKRIRTRTGGTYDLSDDDEGITETLAELRKTSRPRRIVEEDEEEDMDVDEPVGQISDDRFDHFKNRFANLFNMEREESLTEDKVMEWMTQEPQNFSASEVKAGLEKMAKEGKVMISEGMVFLIN